MKKLLFLAALLLSITWTASAQLPVNNQVIYVPTAPSGACPAAPPIEIVISTGVVYTCDNGTWEEATVAQVNGAAIPVSKTVVGTNSSGQIVDASSATLANNTTGTATNATNVATTAKSDNTNYYLALLGSNTSTNQGVNVGSAGLAYYNPSASTFTAPYTTAPAASSATDSASLGPELTTSGTCTGTGWTGTYPNYIAPGTTAALTCTGFTSGSYYQTVTGITNNAGVTAATYVSGISATGSGTCLLAFTGGGGSGATASIAVTSNVPGVITITSPGTAFTSAPTAATVSNGTLTCTGPAVLTSTIGGGTVTVAIGTAQPAASASTASSTLTTGPKANATSLTYTPTAAFVGTMNISAKLISPITTFSYTGKDSTGAVSTTMLYQGLASLHNIFEGGGGTYNTTGSNNSAQGVNALYSNTTGSNNSAQGYQAGYTATPANANVSGSNDVFIGYNSGPGSTTQISNAIAIGSTALVLASNTAVLGNGSITDVYFGGTGAASNAHAATLTVGSSTNNSASSFTFGAATGSGNMISVTDQASNTGTGALLSINTASGSAASPWKATANAVGFAIGNTGSLTSIGGATITYNVNSPPTNSVVCYKASGVMGYATNTSGVIGTTCN